MTQASIVVLYEPNCAFCRLCKAFVEKRDPTKRILFTDINTYPIEFSDNEEIRGQKPLAALEGDRKYTRFRACQCIARYMKEPWPKIAWILYLIPKPIGNWGYDLVANHRDILMKLITWRG